MSLKHQLALRILCVVSQVLFVGDYSKEGSALKELFQVLPEEMKKAMRKVDA